MKKIISLIFIFLYIIHTFIIHGNETTQQSPFTFILFITSIIYFFINIIDLYFILRDKY